MVFSYPACLGVPLKFKIYHERWQRVDADFFQLAEKVNFGGGLSTRSAASPFELMNRSTVSNVRSVTRYTLIERNYSQPFRRCVCE